MERGTLRIMSTTEELLKRKSISSGLESREYGRRDPSSWPLGTLYPQKLAVTSLTSSGCSLSIVRSRTHATEFSLVLEMRIALLRHGRIEVRICTLLIPSQGHSNTGEIASVPDGYVWSRHRDEGRKLHPLAAVNRTPGGAATHISSLTGTLHLKRRFPSTEAVPIFLPSLHFLTPQHLARLTLHTHSRFENSMKGKFPTCPRMEILSEILPFVSFCLEIFCNSSLGEILC
jgi:hypothetical protein